MKRFLSILLTILLLQLSGCNSKEITENQRSEVVSYTSHVSKEDCFLCGDGGAHAARWGEDNVGIISLNTFEVMPVEINRYDNDSELIEKRTGCVTMRMFQSDAGGFQASLIEDADRGSANASISLSADETLDFEKTASFLCQECLDQLTDGVYKNGFAVGAINFRTREIRAFEENITGFGLGNYYIHCDRREANAKEDTQTLGLVIFYCPVRY